jgi:hypothetical protein
VLKAVADVKKLRAATTTAPTKPGQAKTARSDGKKRNKGSKAALDDAFAPEFKEAMSPPARVGVQPSLPDADAGAPPRALPQRK